MSFWTKLKHEDIPLLRTGICRLLKIYRDENTTKAFEYFKGFTRWYFIHITNRYRVSPRNTSEVSFSSSMYLAYHLLLGRFLAAGKIRKEVQQLNVLTESNLSRDQKNFIEDVLALTAESDSNAHLIASFIDNKIELLDYTFPTEFNKWLKDAFEHFDNKLFHLSSELEQKIRDLNLQSTAISTRKTYFYVGSICLRMSSTFRLLFLFMGTLNDFNSVIINYTKGHEKIYIDIFSSSAKACLDFTCSSKFFKIYSCYNDFFDLMFDIIPQDYANKKNIERGMQISRKIFNKLFFVGPSDVDITFNFPIMLTSSFFWRRQLAISFQREFLLSKELKHFTQSIDLYQILLKELREYNDGKLSNKLIHLSAGINADLGALYGIHSGETKKQRGESFSLSYSYLKKALEIYLASSTKYFWGANNLFLECIYRMLGKAHLDSSYGNLDRSIEYLKKAEELSIFSLNLARIYQLLGKAYYRKYEQSIDDKNKKGRKKKGKNFNAAVNIESSIFYLSQAKELLDSQTFPRMCLEICRELGRLYISIEKYSKAIETLEVGIQAIEKNRAWIFSEYYKQQWQDTSVDIYQTVVKACLDNDQIMLALDYVERSKLNSLKELFSESLLCSDDVDLITREKIDSLHRKIIHIQKNLDVGFRGIEFQQSESSISLYAQLCELRGELKKEIQLVNGDKSSFSPQLVQKDFSFTHFQETLDPKTAVIQWYLLENELLTFILTKEDVKVIRSDQGRITLLSNWLDEYLRSYNQVIKSSWRTTLNSRLEDVSRHLNFDEIVKNIPKDCEQLILVPHRLLHLIPLHALPFSDHEGKCLLDKLYKGVKYIPSCHFLQQVLARKRISLDHFLGVQNPLGDLSFSDLQVQVTSRFFNSPKIFKGNSFTKDDVLNFLRENASNHCVHFACHGAFDESSPLESYLKLSQSEDVKLSEVFGLNLSECHLIILSACETGLIDHTTLSDEYVGLPSGFLFAGSSCIVSTLWKVDQLATAFLMIRLYENICHRLSENSYLEPGDVADSLREAQLWLRDLTCERFIDEELQKYRTSTAKILDSLSVGKRKIFEESMLKAIERGPSPFSEPYYWAGFVATGF